MKEDVEQLASFGARRPGSLAGHQAEDYLVDRLRALGLTHVRKEPIAVTAWEADEPIFTVDPRSGEDRISIEAFAIPYSAFTDPRGIDAPLVWADPARLTFDSARCKGKIVVTDIEFPKLDPRVLRRIALGILDEAGDIDDSAHAATWVRLHWHLYREATRAGALGFIGILKDQPGGSCRMYAPYGFKEKDVTDKPLPGAWIGRDDGAWLRAKLTSPSASDVTAHLMIQGRRTPSTTHNVIAEIPGTTEETIVLSCHHDSPFVSPVEDASGCAVILALAKHLSEGPKLSRTIVILLTAGHFYGSIGTRTFLEAHKAGIVKIQLSRFRSNTLPSKPSKMATGISRRAGAPSPMGIFLPWSKSVLEIVRKNLTANGIDRVVMLTPEGPLGSYPPTDGGDWYAAGIPVINAISNPVYLLTDDDALHWVAWEKLPHVAAAFASIVRDLDVVPREVIAAMDRRRRRTMMRALAIFAKAKTTWFGLRPIH